VKAQAALVGTERAVELDAEPAVDVDASAVVVPWHAEDDLPLGLADALERAVLAQLGVFVEHRAERPEHFEHRLVELGFGGVAADHLLVERFEALVDVQQHAGIIQSRKSG
jgi:hypothetical protein